MNIEFKQSDQTALITIAGNIDALTAGEVSQFIHKLVDFGHKQFVVDLSQVDFMSSAGLRAILAELKESRQLGGDLRLAGAQPGVEKVLSMSGFTSIIKTYPTANEALSSFAG